jgi:hypothetical protein
LVKRESVGKPLHRAHHRVGAGGEHELGRMVEAAPQVALDQVAICEASLPYRGSVAPIGGRPVPLSDHPAIGARVEFQLDGG